MHTVIRTYAGSGARALFDLLEKRTPEVESLVRSVQGLVSYTLVRTTDGGFSVTTCNDKAGVDESVKKAREWIAENATGTGASAPTIAEGTVILHVK